MTTTPAAVHPCALCGLDTREPRFCCAGCENVYAILVESGVIAGGQDFRQTDLYRESLRLGLIANPAKGDAPPIPEGAETREAVFHVGGMWCNSCGWLIEHALAKTRGVVSAEVLFASDLLKVRYCPQYLPKERIVDRVAAVGYRAGEYTGQSDAADAERKDLLLRTGIAAFLSLNVMTFSLVVYASYFGSVAGWAGRFVPFLLMALATPSVFWCAAPILRLAWAGARNGVLRMESLLSLGILTAYGYSAAEAFRGGQHVYFDTACAIVTLVLTGKSIERAAKDRAARALTLLHRLMPTKARIVQEGRERFVAVDALTPGAVFLVKPGERIPADGVVVTGSSHADESVLTGEARPVAKAPGDAVVSGSVNGGGVLEVRATRTGGDSTLAQIVRVVEQAAASRTRIERTVDRIARVFIPAVLAIALFTFAGWWWRTGSPADSLMHAIAVLVIACPCALGIATPLALTFAVSAASRRGILVSDTRVLETIRGIDVVVLDKTGTATEGEFRLLSAAGDTSRMRQLAALEAYSEHPVARAIVAGHGDLPPARDVAVTPGQGIEGTVDGVHYFVRRGDGAPDSPSTTVSFGWDGEARGTLTLGDRVRPEAAALCAGLRARGIRTLLLSGDSPAATEAVAREIGATEWIGGALPARKVEVLRELQAAGQRVAMIGDGVNDAPSLAQADLGIALGSGTAIAIQAAPLVLMKRSLTAVLDTLDLAGRTFAIVRQNLFWAFLYNVFGILLAVTGVLTPILAAGAMILSSLSVIGNSRRIL
ncbi:MAG: cadmium-translocating P-type ATPase [Acidobacteria bacterium]|nr:cadmium-translocating P-type ATPase [Acidobacteriota bacterium]